MFRYERQYPQGALYGNITGYYSRVYGRTGLEQAMQPYLSGTASELAASNITDLILGRPKKGGTVVTTIEPRLQQPVGRLVAHDGRHLVEDRLQAEAVLERAAEELHELRQLACR